MAQQICPRCGSDNVEIKMYKENLGSQTITTSKSKYKEKGHGLIWWLFIGSWWWIIDLCMWLCFFPLRLIMQLFKKKKYVGKSTSVSTTMHNVDYRSMCLCKDCGYNWDAAKRAPVSRPRSSDNGSRSAGSAKRSLPSSHELQKEDFTVVGIQYYANNFRQLATPNPDYDLPDDELKELFTTKRRIGQYTYITKPVELVPDPTNEHDPNAIEVHINGLLVGFISSDDNAHVLSLLKRADIKYISSYVQGGKYCFLGEFGDILEKQVSPNITVRIAYSR